MIKSDHHSRFATVIDALYELFPQLDKFYKPSAHSRNGSYGGKPGIYCVVSGSWKTVEEQCPVTIDGITFTFHSFEPGERGDDRDYPANVNLLIKLDSTWN